MSCIQVGAFIITPTRELARQIDEVLSTFLTNIPQFTHMLLVGGNNPAADIEQFNGKDVLVSAYLYNSLIMLKKTKEIIVFIRFN